MNKKDKEKAEMGAKTIQSFFELFGTPDTYNIVLLETLLEELHGACKHEDKPISLPSQTRQKRN